MMAVAVLKMESGKQFEEVTVDVLANDAVGFDHREGIIINREPPDITLHHTRHLTRPTRSPEGENPLHSETRALGNTIHLRSWEYKAL